MGLLQKLLDAIGFAKPQCKVLCVGLDNSGKSTVIQHLKPKQGAVKEVTPTVGFNVEQFARSAINFTVFDMSGAGKYRSLWEHYYKDAQAIIFVIDCSDKLRMCVVKEEMQSMLQHPDTRGVPTLFFANKIDISDHLNPVECVQYLDLDSVKDRPWHITPSNALSGAAPYRDLAQHFVRFDKESEARVPQHIGRANAGSNNRAQHGPSPQPKRALTEVILVLLLCAGFGLDDGVAWISEHLRVT